MMNRLNNRTSRSSNLEPLVCYWIKWRHYLTWHLILCFSKPIFSLLSSLVLLLFESKPQVGWCHFLSAEEAVVVDGRFAATNSAQARIKSVEDFKSFLSHSVFISWCSKMFPDSSELKLRPRRCLVTNTQVHDWTLNIIRHHSTALTQHCF